MTLYMNSAYLTPADTFFRCRRMEPASIAGLEIGGYSTFQTLEFKGLIPCCSTVEKSKIKKASGPAAGLCCIYLGSGTEKSHV